MVWFQCEDCGENLKKPKLVNHFKICSAYKLSCIDCGETFGQQSVQGHTQCVTEAEKYGPKGQGKAPNGTPAKSKNDSKQKPEVDINVGLSSRPPWHCSLCKTNATSKQTLLLHAEGKKHRAKARAFHASKQPPKPVEESSNTKPTDDERKGGSTPNIDEARKELLKATQCNGTVEENESLSGKKKRKHGGSDGGNDSGNNSNEVGDKSNGEVIQAKRAEEEPKRLKQDTLAVAAEEEQTGYAQESSDQKIKWKKLITSILKSCPDGSLKMKKLQKLVLKSVQESGTALDESKLKDTIADKVNGSSRFTIDGKIVRLVVKS